MNKNKLTFLPSIAKENNNNNLENNSSNNSRCENSIRSIKFVMEEN
jgi:hypothetical protein